jgi:DNA (cytosine-5)-methyltransferase 1
VSGAVYNEIAAGEVSGEAREQRLWADDGADGTALRPGPTNGVWRDADWLGCRDGKWRPVEPGSFPLADGIPGRVGRLRAYGNAIDPHVAAAFIAATEEARQ